MTATLPDTARGETLVAAPRRRSRRSVAVPIAVGLLVALVLVAVLVPLLSGASATTVNLSAALRPPVWGGGTWDAPLGTDRLGRDVLAQLSAALRISAVVAAVSVVLAGMLGALLGMAGGYLGGWVDFVVGRITEAQLGLPVLVVAITLSIALGPSLSTIIVAIALTSWVPFARLVRAETLVLRETDFVQLARIAGVPARTVLGRHLLPNILPPLVILATQQVATAVIEAASLSYLGLGVQPPTVDLGSMIAQNQILLTSYPSLPLVPIVALAALALAVNVLGERLHERLEARA